MKKIRFAFAALSVLIVAACCSAEVNGREVAYVGGTGSIAVDSVGTLDMQRPDALVFRAGTASMDIVIPYSSISSVAYRRQLARHLGVVAGTVVSLIRKRERKHFFDIAYTDAQGTKQTASFEVSKDEPQVLAAVLRTRAPQACKTGCNADDPGIFG